MIREALLFSFSNFIRYKARTFFTVLGVLLGAVLMTVVFILGDSFTQKMINVTKFQGERALTFSVGQKETLRVIPVSVLNRDNLYSVKQQAHVQLAAPVGIYQAHDEPPILSNADNKNHTLLNLSLWYTTDEYFKALDIEYSDGQGFKDAGNNNFIIGSTAAKTYDLKKDDRIKLRILSAEPKEYVVGGIIAKQKEQAFSDFPNVINNMVALPFKDWPYSSFQQIVTKIDNPTNISSVEKVVVSQLNNDPKISKMLKNTGSKIIGISQVEITKMTQEWVYYAKLFAFALAVIGSLIGAIGVANIMLVIVTERTKEIGIMRAIGARRRQIILLFLIEAVLISLIGSFLGLMSGLLINSVAVKFLEIPLVISWPVILWVLSLGISVGVISGLYPAVIASRMNPAKAISYE